MKWVEKIRNKPKEERIRIIWIFVIVGAALLIALWIATWGYKKSAPQDTTFFDTAAKSYEDLRKQLRSNNK